MMTKTSASDAELHMFNLLYDEIDELLRQHADQDDFTVFGDYWDHRQIKVSVHNLALLHPYVIAKLQKVVTKFDGWEIILAIAIEKHFDDWPAMGLKIRAHEIIDGLQRQYFPPEFRSFSYERARRGTEGD